MTNEVIRVKFTYSLYLVFLLRNKMIFSVEHRNSIISFEYFINNFWKACCSNLVFMRIDLHLKGKHEKYTFVTFHQSTALSVVRLFCLVDWIFLLPWNILILSLFNTTTFCLKIRLKCYWYAKVCTSTMHMYTQQWAISGSHQL